LKRPVNTRGSTRSHQQPPLVYVPKQKTETEEDKIMRYERVIDKLKKMLEHDRRLLKGARGQYQREMSFKTELEVILRDTVEQVRAEKVQQKKGMRGSHYNGTSGGARFMMNSASAMSMGGGALAEDWLEEINSQQDRERVVELMLSQERVIELLYEKTFAMTSADPNQLNYLDEPNRFQDDEEQEEEVEEDSLQ